MAPVSNTPSINPTSVICTFDLTLVGSSSLSRIRHFVRDQSPLKTRTIYDMASAPSRHAAPDGNFRPPLQETSSNAVLGLSPYQQREPTTSSALVCDLMIHLWSNARALSPAPKCGLYAQPSDSLNAHSSSLATIPLTMSSPELAAVLLSLKPPFPQVDLESFVVGANPQNFGTRVYSKS